MNEPYGFEETFGFNSIRSEIDDEILKNRKTDAQQSEDITTEGEERAAADEAIDSRLDALEEQSESTSQLKEDFDAFTGTTYANDKAALEEKDSALEAKDTELEQSISDEAARAEAKEAELEAALENEKTQREEKDAEIEDALEAINGDGDGSIKKAVADGIAEVVANAPEDLDTLKEVADYIASDKTKAAEIETKLSDHDSAIDALEAKDEELVAKDAELQAEINDEATRATAAESELDGKIVAEQARAEAKEAEIDARDDAQEEEIAKKVDWVVSEGERKHIVLKNHDSILGTATDGGTYNVAMVSKWDVADFGSAQLHANLNSKDGIVTINDDKAIATKDEVEAVDAKVEAIDLAPYAKTEDVNAELANKANASDLSALNDTVGQLSSKVDEKAAQSDLEAFEASSTEALNAEVARAEAKEAELIAKDTELEAEINDEATRATAAESELQGKITAEQARAEAKEAELQSAIDTEKSRAEAKENELAEEIDKKVEWTESTLGRNHIVLKNHDSILGTATDGGTYNVAMVSKWDVADFGSAQLHLNLNSKDAATINDDQVIATENVVDAKIEAAVSAINSKDEAQDAEIALKAVKADVDAALELKADKTELEPLAKSADVTAEIAAAVEPLATKEELTNAAAEAVAKVVAEAPEDFDTLKEVADYIASDKTKATEIESKLSEHDAAIEALNSKDVELNAAINDEAARATAAESELDGKIVAEQARAEAKEAELAAKDEAQDVEIAKKVDWVESTPGRNHIVLKNHDSVLGTATDGTTYNVAMVSKWDVADFGTAQLHANLNSKDGIVTINDDKVVATKDDVEAVDAKVEAIDLTPYVKSEDMNAAVEALNAKDAELEAAIPQAAANAVAQVVANAPEDLDTLKEVADYIAADKTKAVEIENKLAELTAKDAELVAKDEAQDAEIALKADKTELEPLATKEEVANVDAKFADYATADALAQVEEKKVDWVESTPDRKHIVLKNHDSILGTATDGSTYNVAMVSKWDVADFGSAQLHLNLNSKDGSVTINDNKNIATEDYVSASIDGLAKSDDVTAAIATAIEPLATKVEVESAAAAKANAEDVYTKTESDEKFQASGDYVPIEKYNDLKARLDNLEIMMSVYNAEREAQMDEIISNMSSDNKEVVTDTLMESIVVPETTVAYTITAPLTDNSTVELTSPKYMTLINTSKEPVSTTISHTYEEGETTAATSVYLVGDFDTLTIENISPSVKSGYDAASVKNVVIPETNVKNLSLALDFQDGATITNNSDKDITIMDKNDSANALTIVAPNSTVTLSSGQFTTLNAEVSDNTLIIKKNVHIANLNLAKGNAIVEVARAEEVASIVENYTVADGYSLSHRIYHITNENSGKLGGVGEMILDEDITRTSSIVAPLAPAYDAVWNLNGHNITVEGTPKSGVYLNRYASNLEVKGEGVIRAEGAYGLWNNGTTGKIIINDGVTIEAQTHAVYAEKGIIEINGGTFKLTNWADADKDENGNLRFLINCLDANYRNGSANIIVKGGKFYDFDPANCAAEGVGTSFVADGYVSVMTTEMIDGVEHKVYTVQEA